MGQYTLAVTMPSWDYNCNLDDADLVVNGYHRLFIARQLGIKTVPARVIAPQP